MSSAVSSATSGSSIYGSRNVNILSGLASGLDTEGMIEGLVESYETKISGLEQDKTMVQWQQEQIQKISNMLIEFNNTYNSYTSSTNLSSPSFFSNASLTEALGEFADKISATGDSNSDILINSVAQLATSTTYKTSASDLLSAGGTTASSSGTNIKGEVIPDDLGGTTTVSNLEGSLTVKYGNKSIKIEFDELEFLDESGTGSGTVSSEQLKTAIEDKLSEEKIYFDDGTSVDASERIGVEVTADGIKFVEKGGAGNGVSISEATGKLETTLGLESVADDQDSFSFATGTHTSEVSTMKYLQGETFDITFNGEKTTLTIDETWTADNFAQKLEDGIAKAFGNGKVDVNLNGGALEFDVQGGSSFKIESDAGSALGFGEDGAMMSYVDLEMKLKDLGYTGEDVSIEVNGVLVEGITENSTLSDVLSKINGNDEIGVKASYSTTTNQFVFTTEETGAGREISFGGTVGTSLFGDTSDPSAGIYTEGVDAVVSATINGENVVLNRSSNSFDIDGMKVSLKGTFNKGTYEGTIVNGMKEDGTALTAEEMFGVGEAVSFNVNPDSDKIVETIVKMATDYNEIMEAVKSAYADAPLEQSSGSEYQPLTAADKEDMTESEIAAYEEKAKTGILFMDSDLSQLYTEMRNAMESVGTSTGDLAEIGITTTYLDGLTTMNVNEEKLREALEEDPSKVEEVFTNNTDYGSTYNGLMANLDPVLERFAKTSGEPKGILVSRAGSIHSPTTAINNLMLKEISEIEEEIETWQDKMFDKVDYYTAQFTRLEVLINEMNSQSSAFSGMMGG